MKNINLRFGASNDFYGCVLAAAFLLSGCASSGSGDGGNKSGSPVYYGLAILAPTKGEKATGRVHFSEAFGKVKIEATIEGLDPSSKHAIHIHEFGDCTAPDGASAGGHYNPAGHIHASPKDEKRHAGDLGNLITDKKGVAKLSLEVEELSINGSANPILGRAVIVHKNPDDFLSQPTGGAGPRIACGVIGAASK